MVSKIFECLVCDFIQQLRLAPQVKCEIIFTFSFFIIFLTGLISLKAYLTSLYMFKDFHNHIDYNEFNELKYIEINLENRELQLQNKFQEYALIFIKLFKNIYNNYNLYKNVNINNDHIKCDDNESEKHICNNNEQNINDNQEIYKKIYTTFDYLLEIYLKNIFNHTNIFHSNIIEKKDLQSHIIFINFTLGSLYYYPGDNSLKKIENEEFNTIKSYSIQKIIKNVKSILSFNELFPNNTKGFSNLYYLPLFQEFSKKFQFYKDEKILTKISSIIFELKDDNFNINELSSKIECIVFVISKLSITDLIYNDIMKRTSGLTILKTNYLYPYKLKNEQYCRIVENLGKYNDLFKNETKNYNYIDNCFKQNTISKYSKYEDLKEITFLQEFMSNFNLFNRLEINNEKSSDLHNKTDIDIIINGYEEKLIKEEITSYNQTINKIISINNEDFKVSKSICPINSYSLLEYYYPINKISLNFLIKNEGFAKYIQDEIKITMYAKFINILIPHFIILTILIFIIWIILTYFSKQLNNPVQKLNDPSFLTGQINQKENVKKYKNKETNIDEFKELIRLINEMVKGDIDLKQVHTKKEEFGYKLDIEKFNKEFEKNKIYNIIVKRDEIENILEEGNYSSQIIKQDIENIKKDKYVKKSLLFNNATQFKEEFENENEEDKKLFSNINIKNIKNEKKKKEIISSDRTIKTEKFEKLFKNNNTLQNRNSLIYYYFKKEYFPSWYSHHHFKEEKDEKKDNKRDITMQNISSDKNINEKEFIDNNDIINNNNLNFVFFKNINKNNIKENINKKEKNKELNEEIEDVKIENKKKENEEIESDENESEKEDDIYEEIDTSKKNLPNQN